MEVIDASEIQTSKPKSFQKHQKISSLSSSSLSSSSSSSSTPSPQLTKSSPSKDKGKQRSGSAAAATTLGVSSSIGSGPQQSNTPRYGSVTKLPDDLSSPDTGAPGKSPSTTNTLPKPAQASSRRRSNFDETEDLAYVPPQPITLEDRSFSQDPQSAGVWAKDVHVGNYTVIQGNTKLGAYVVWTIEIEVLKPVEEEERGGEGGNKNKSGQKKKRDGSDEGSDSEPEPGPQDINWSLHSPHIPHTEGPISPTVSITGNSGGGVITGNSNMNGLPIPQSHAQGGAHQVITIRRRYSEFYTLRERLWYAYPRQRHGIPELPPKSVVSKFREGFLENRRRGLEFFLLTVLLNPVFARSPIVKEFVRGGGGGGLNGR